MNINIIESSFTKWNCFEVLSEYPVLSNICFIKYVYYLESHYISKL